MTHYEVIFVPTKDSSYDARTWDSYPNVRTLAQAREYARQYQAEYPERKQRALIIERRLVAAIEPDGTES